MVVQKPVLNERYGIKNIPGNCFKDLKYELYLMYCTYNADIEGTLFMQ